MPFLPSLEAPIQTHNIARRRYRQRLKCNRRCRDEFVSLLTIGTSTSAPLGANEGLSSSPIVYYSIEPILTTTSCSSGPRLHSATLGG
jgi:hypothetical protein